MRDVLGGGGATALAVRRERAAEEQVVQAVAVGAVTPLRDRATLARAGEGLHLRRRLDVII